MFRAVRDYSFNYNPDGNGNTCYSHKWSMDANDWPKDPDGNPIEPLIYPGPDGVPDPYECIPFVLEHLHAWKDANPVSTSRVCELNHITSPNFYCSQVKQDMCETRGKIRTDGTVSACIVDGESCTMSDDRFDCSSYPSADHREVCELRTIFDSDDFCYKHQDDCETRSKLRADGYLAACTRDANSVCTQSDEAFECSTARANKLPRLSVSSCPLPPRKSTLRTG